MNTTQQINNKHYIECDFVMLPTDVSNRYNCTKDLIVKCIKSWTPIGEDEKKVNTLSISKNWSEGVLEYYQPQHLYVLSNEDIKVGDWILTPYNEIYQVVKFNGRVPVNKNGNGNLLINKKVIATTDTSLFKKEKTSTNKHSYIYDTLPQIPKQFIEYYINEYNKGNMITKVMVEWLRGSGGHYDENQVWHWKMLAPLIHPKNNEINILNPSKQNEDEIEEFVNTNYFFFTEDTRKKMILGINSWINKNNLKTK